MSGINYKFGDFFSDTQKRELFFHNNSVDISAKAFDILECLIKNRESVVTKDKLFDSIWSDSFVEENNLPVHISALRRVLGEKRGEAKYIKTIFGRGYKFIAPVVEVDKRAKNNFFKSENYLSEQIDNSKKLDSIAVLPLAAPDNNEEIEYLAEGITQDLINHLAQFSELKVMAFSAVKNYAASKLDMQEIGFQMNVNKILSGTIRKFKNNLDINVELINVKDNSYLWGTQYNCRFGDVFSVRKQISENISRKLKIGGSAGNFTVEAERKPVNSEAYNLYLKGLHIFTKFTSSDDRRKSLDSALNLFQQSVRKDADFAQAYAAIGKVHFFQYNNGFITKDDARSLCRTAFQRAIKCDPALSEAFTLEGMMKMFFEFDFAAANDCFIKAEELNPNDAYAYHMQSLLFIVLEKFDDAFAAQNKAIRLDPTSSAYNCGLLNRFFFTENYNQAIIHAEETIELNERSVPAYLVLALANAMLGIFDEALKAIRQAQEFSAAFAVEEYVLTEGFILALAGKEQEAREIVKKITADKHLSKNFFVEIAAIYVALGEAEKAIDFLEIMSDVDYLIIFLLKLDPRLTALRENPRFTSLLQKIAARGNFPDRQN